MTQLLLSLEWRLDQLKRISIDSLSLQQQSRISELMVLLRNEIAFDLSQECPTNETLEDWMVSR